jgi:uroporphyrinogen-III decarboxylase
MNQNYLLSKRLSRIKKAVALEKPDRVPVVLEYCAFAARVTNTPLHEFLLSLEKSVQTMIQAYQNIIRGADAVNYGRFSPYGLSNIWLSKVKVPGVDLAVDMSYQVVEREMMGVEDYDRIIEDGWPAFYRGFLKEKILDSVPPEFLPSNQSPVDVIQEWAKIGVPILQGGIVAPPFEFLCGGRSLNGFFMDLIDIPDKVEMAMDKMLPNISAPVCRQAEKQGYPAVWVGGWRGAPGLVSPEMWDRFFWPYFKRLVLEVVEFGLIPILHLDSNWNRELTRFRELPGRKVIMALDGHTDIFKAKEILGDHMCLMGDVPATMLSFDDPETVYEYSSRLIRELGPEGFILQSGCDIPENGRLENVQAMVSAALDA